MPGAIRTTNKLSDEIALEIIKADKTISHAEIGRKYSISDVLVGRIRAGKTYKHLPRMVEFDEATHRKCKKCNRILDFSFFTTTRKSSRSAKCKDCIHEMEKIRREKRKTGEIQYYQRSIKKCCGCKVIKIISKFYPVRSGHDGVTSLCRDCFKEERKKYPDNRALRCKTDFKLKLRRRIGAAIRLELKKQRKRKKHSCLLALSFSIGELLTHLQNQYSNEMTEQNYGEFWGIDHIIPQSKLEFGSMDEVNFKICWAIENLRPLEKSQNSSKNNKITPDAIDLLKVLVERYGSSPETNQIFAEWYGFDI